MNWCRDKLISLLILPSNTATEIPFRANSSCQDKLYLLNYLNYVLSDLVTHPEGYHNFRLNLDWEKFLLQFLAIVVENYYLWFHEDALIFVRNFKFSIEVHKGDDLKHALMISARVPLLMTGNVCRKSPANTKVISPMRAEKFLFF